MGGCISASAYGIPPESCASAFECMRREHGCDVLVMAVKGQNHPGKLCLAGGADQNLADAITRVLRADPGNAAAEQRGDEHDRMWTYVWRNTSLTSGHATLSQARSYFPRGRLVVQLLDTITRFGWGLAAAPHFGGVVSRDDDASNSVDWPVFVFYREKDPELSAEHLMLAVKDANSPGKLCAAGPATDMEEAMAEALRGRRPGVVSGKDSFDADYDVVWRNTSITSGAQALTLAKAYFPRGRTSVALLQCAYSFGWRLVAAPSFGGRGASWPCFLFRRLRDPSAAPPPELLVAAIKDSNTPGKVCMAGPSACEVADAVCGALAKVPGNGGVRTEADSYDEDFDAVCRHAKITTGAQNFSRGCSYFPRGDSMKALMDAVAWEGFHLVACPNFGGPATSWPTFVFEKRGDAPQQMLLAVKDSNNPGKVDLAGAGVGQDSALGAELLSALRALCGPEVSQAADDHDESYELAYRHTKLTAGNSTFAASTPFWPHGHVLVAILQILLKHGFAAAGGPSFGAGGSHWPCIVFGRHEAPLEAGCEADSRRC